MEYYLENCERINPAFNKLFTFINTDNHPDSLQKNRF